MYMPGRLRTSSRTRRTVIRLESSTVLWTPCSASWLDSVIRLGTPTATGEPAPRHISYGCFNCSISRAEPPSGRPSVGILGRIHPTRFPGEPDGSVPAQGGLVWPLGPGDEHLGPTRRHPPPPPHL